MLRSSLKTLLTYWGAHILSETQFDEVNI